MAKLDIIIGPMFAGKSSELIKRIRQLKVLKKEYIVIKPLIDTRYSDDHIVSHNNDMEHCISINNINDFIANITNFNINNIETIFIDEGQFFPDLKENVLKLVEEYNKNIVIVGLDGDFNRNKFGQILDLIPYCDTCVKIKSLCVLCNDMTPAIFTKKISNNDNQVEIGNENIYRAVCRYHYFN